MKPLSEGLSNQDFINLKSAIDEAAIVAITDEKGVITYVNKRFCAISKYSEAELIGKTHRIINSHYHPPDFFTQMWSVISQGKVWDGEIRNRAKDWSYYWVHTTIVPFMNDTGRPVQYVAVRYEITERKLAEEQNHIYAKRLEISNRELQDFASVAAHDLQEPLRKIQTFSDRLKAKTKDILTGEAFDYVERIQASAQRMQVLINDLLAYSRVTTKGQPFSVTHLDQIILHAVSDLEIRLEKNNGKVEWQGLPSLEADPTQMHQLFLNLIGNALKFCKPEVSPKVKITSKILASSPLARKGPACQITVEDNGIGFDEKYLDRIFTIFQRLHGRHEYEGTGIGLAVCRKIVDRHSGIITAKSMLGTGSAFIVTLPLKQLHTEGE